MIDKKTVKTQLICSKINIYWYRYRTPIVKLLNNNTN